jgi:hypothetical protein
MKNFDHINKIDETFRNLGNLSKLKQREVFCPIAGLKAITTPLLASDDLVLRTTISSVDTYDFELIKLIYEHTIFPELDISGKKFNINTFISNLSHIDKQVLIWGIFASTYETLGEQKLTCTECKHDNFENIKLNDLIQEDSFALWNETLPFIDFVFPITKVVEIENIYALLFNTSLSTIKQHLDMLNLLSSAKLKENFEKSGVMFSRAEELSTVTRNIIVYKTVDDQDPMIFTNIKDIHVAISKFIPLNMIDEILESYGEKFNSYAPKFKKTIICNGCGKDFIYSTDIEFSLFRRFLRR